jgi:hypothetical protein
MSRHPLRITAAILCAALASTALVACGGSGSGADSPSSSASHAANDSLKFARCMREHGVQAETSGEGIRVTGAPNITPRMMEATQNACRTYSPGAPSKRKLTPAEQVAQEEAVQKFAKCMREHGVKVEAQTSSSHGSFEVRIGIHGSAGEGGPKPESPTFQSAQKACPGLMPRPPGASKSGLPSAPPAGAPKQENQGFGLSTGH